MNTRKKRYSSELTVCFLNNNTVISRLCVSAGMQRKILANILLHKVFLKIISIQVNDKNQSVECTMHANKIHYVYPSILQSYAKY
jgi:hypothetical protein